MPLEPINIHLFDEVETTVQQTSIPVVEVKSRDVKSNWICKFFAEDARRAWFEVYSQELCRVLIERQPITQLAKDDKANYYVLSQKIENFRNFTVPPTEHLNSHEEAQFEQDLGEVLLTAILLHEVDLNLKNIGLDQNNRVIKLDGDWALAGLTHSQTANELNTDITPELLYTLPLISDYYVFNWLDIIKKEENTMSSDVIDITLSNSPHFRLGVNQAILRFLLLPARFIQQFHSAYTLEDQSFISELQVLLAFTQRQEELLSCALQNESFVSYLNTYSAKRLSLQYLNSLKNFRGHQSPVINTDQYKDLEADYSQKAQKLLGNISRINPTPTTVTGLDSFFVSLSNSSANFIPTLSYTPIQEDEIDNDNSLTF